MAWPVDKETGRAIIGGIFAGGTVLAAIAAIIADKANVPLALGVLSTLSASVASSYFTAKAVFEARRQS